MRLARAELLLIAALLALFLSQPSDVAVPFVARFRRDAHASRLRSRSYPSIASLLTFKGRIRKATKRAAEGGLRRLGYRSQPEFLIIGTQKGGTWALHHYLAAHPLVIGPRTSKEIHFFDQDRLFRRGMTWYSKYFPLPHALRGGKQTFDHTTSYMYYPKATERIYRHVPHVKLIVLLREPVSRAFSAWNMFRHLHTSPEQIVPVWQRQFDPPALMQLTSFLSRDPFPDFATAVKEELGGTSGHAEVSQPGLIRRGYYDEQLAQIFAIFSRDQVLVLESSRLRSQPREVLELAVDFLGLPRFAWPDHVLVPHHTGGYVDIIDSEIRSMLTEVFRPRNNRLFELLGVDLGWNRTS